MAKHCLKVGKKSSRSEVRNLPTWCCKSMMEGLTIMLGVFITLIYIYIQCQTSTIVASLHLWDATWWPNIAWKWAKGKKSRSEARNLPTWCCKSMMEGLTIMLGVFITLIYIYTMPNKYYCSKPTSLRCHLMAKHCLKVGKKSRSVRQETCQHGAVKVWWRDLQSCWECSSLWYTYIQCQTNTIVASLHLWGATWWPNIAWKWAKNRDLLGKKPANMVL